MNMDMHSECRTNTDMHMRRRVVMPDLLGFDFGWSRPTAPLAWRAHVESLVEFLEILVIAVGAPVDVVGHRCDPGCRAPPFASAIANTHANMRMHMTAARPIRICNCAYAPQYANACMSRPRHWMWPVRGSRCGRPRAGSLSRACTFCFDVI